MLALYIDPGTGSMLFTILIGVVTAVFFALQQLKVKLNFIFHGGGDSKSIETEIVPYVIFSDDKRYWNVFKPICDEFENRKIPCEYLTASPDDPALDSSYKYVKCLFIGEGNKAFSKLNMLKADICLATTPGLDVYQWKRSKNTKFYVHTLHEVGGVTGYEMFGLDYYDAILLSGRYKEKYIRELESKRNIKEKELLVVGSTYMDIMQEKANALINSNKNIEIPTILLAPSWGKVQFYLNMAKKY